MRQYNERRRILDGTPAADSAAARIAAGQREFKLAKAAGFRTAVTTRPGRPAAARGSGGRLDAVLEVGRIEGHDHVLAAPRGNHARSRRHRGPLRDRPEFDRQVVVPNPDVNGREAILKVHARKVRVAHRDRAPSFG